MTAPVLSLDLGSRRIGAVSAPALLPLRPVGRTIPVDPANIEPVLEHLSAILHPAALSAVVLEHAPLYMPPGKSPAGYREIAAAHEVCSRLHERIVLMCRERGIAVVTVARQTWAHRVVPRTRGGITDAMANDGLVAHCDGAALATLEDQDQRDAAGALVGWLLGPPKKAGRARAKGPPRPLLTAEQRAANRRVVVARCVKRASVARDTARLRSGCSCGPDGGPRLTGARGRHRRLCPMAPPPKAIDARGYVPMTR